MRILPLGLALAITLNAQRPAFEVASVKPHEFPASVVGVGNGGTIRIAGNRVTLLGSLLGFVLSAYNLKEYQISGAPVWNDARGRLQAYDIEARTEGDVTPSLDQTRAMLQTLLADRFQLKVHREAKELPVYELVAGKSGPKLKPHSGETIPPEAPAFSGGQATFKFSNRPVADLIRMLDMNVDRPVLDKTGLAGGYDFTLTFTMAPPNSANYDGSIYAAVEALGLKLTPAKAPVDILVIDHADKPSQN